MADKDRHSAAGNDWQQPEALRSLKTASHTGGEKPREQGMTASRSTAPLRQNPRDKDKEATRLLAEGAKGRTPQPRPPTR
jgi:hypothetical protein